MGCFFSCFRLKADRKRETNRLKSSPVPPKNREPLLSNDQFVSVFVSEGSPCGSPDFKNSIDGNDLERELRDEVKFLKSCGLLLESPAEFRNTSTLDKGGKSSNISSSLPVTFLGQFLRDEKSEGSGFQLDSSAGCCFEGQLEQPIHENSPPSVILSSLVCLEGVNCDPSLESALESVAMDVSPSEEDIHDSSLPSVTLNSSVCLEGVNNEPGLESALDVSPSQVDIHLISLPSVTLSSSVCLDGANHDLGLVSPSQEDIHESSPPTVCLEGVNHDPSLEPALESVAMDVSPSEEDIHDSSLPSVTLNSSVCLEGVNNEPGLESALDVSPSQVDIHVISLPSITLSSSVCLDGVNHDLGLVSPSHEDIHESSPPTVCLEGVNHDPSLESALESVAMDVSPSEEDLHDSSLPSVTLNSSVCLEGVNNEPGLESALDISPSQVDIHVISLPSITLSSSVCLDGVNHDLGLVSPSHEDIHESSPPTVCLEGVNHDPSLESALESVAMDVSPSEEDLHDSSLPSVTLNSSVCLEGVNNEPGLESALDVSSSQVDIHVISLPSVTLSSSVSLDGVNHDLGLDSPSQEDIHESSPPTVTLSSSVCLEGVNHSPVLQSALESVASPSQDDIHKQPHGPRYSPYPTPLKLTDNMETPGTIYPTSQRNLRTKHVRSQYVYPVLNPVENLSHWAVLSEGCESEKIKQKSVALSSKNINDKRFSHLEVFDKENYGSVNRQRSMTPLSAYKGGRLMSTSLSHWLKPPPANGEKNGSDFTEAVKIKDTFLERTPDGSRPILGIAGVEDVPFHITPKLWGGNGIPHTTTKYKEDQKVSWHATPFEERLDKALSDNKLFPERKLVGFEDEGAESDA